jgi:hypothetical protein
MDEEAIMKKENVHEVIRLCTIANNITTMTAGHHENGFVVWRGGWNFWDIESEKQRNCGGDPS